MIVVWETDIKRRRIGRVADFCPVCRKLRVQEMLRIGAAGHLYYIWFGKGKLVGHELICSTCHVTRETDIDQCESVSFDPDPDLAQLERETFPTWREVWMPRRERARQLEAGRLSPDERQRLIQDLFFLLDDALERQYEVRPFSPRGKKVATATVAYFLLFVAASFLLNGFLRGGDSGDLTLLVLAPLISGFFATLYFMCTRHSWYMRHRLRPQVARALRPLQPTHEELGVALEEMKRLSLRIGKKLKAGKILDWIDPRDDGLTI